MSNRFNRWLPMVLPVALFGFVLLFPEQAHASATGGSGLPWETPIQRFVDSMLGPVSLAMVLIGFVGGVFGFMTGGEINGFVRGMVVMILSGSILLAAKPFITGLFGISAALH